jgi:hypothetical protein
MLKAGRYYVGDLCYLFGDEDGCIFTDSDWQTLLADTKFFNGDADEGDEGDSEGGQFRWRGTEFFVSGTAHGDGTYRDTTGREFWVDAGIIGCWPLPVGDAPKGGHIVTFDTDFEGYTVDSDGVIEIGNIRIETDGSGGDEDEYEEEEEEEEDADEEDEDEDEDTDEEDGEK